MRRNQEFNVELPKFSTSYAKRQQILDNIVEGKVQPRKVHRGYGFSWVAIAALLLLALISPTFLPGWAPLGPGIDGLRLANEWHSAGANVADQDARILGLEVTSFGGRTSFQMRVLVKRGGDRWDEYVLDSSSGVTVNQRLGLPSNIDKMPDTSFLRTLDQVGLQKLVGNQGTVRLQIDSPSTWWGPGNVMIVGSRDLISLEENYVEFLDPHVRLVSTVREQVTNYLIPLGNYKVHDMGRLKAILDRSYKVNLQEVLTLSRYSGGWEIDAMLSQGRALILIPDGNQEQTVNYWDLPRYNQHQVVQIAQAITGLKVKEVQGFEAGYWTLHLDDHGQDRMVKLSDSDGAIVWRDFELTKATPGNPGAWVFMDGALHYWLNGRLDPTYQVNEPIRLQGLGKGVVVEDEKGSVLYVDDQSFRFDGLRAHQFRISPGGKILIQSRLPTQAISELYEAGHEVWLAGGYSFQSMAGAGRTSFGGPIIDAQWVDDEQVALLVNGEVLIYSLSTREVKKVMEINSNAQVCLEATTDGFLIIQGLNNQGKVYHWRRGQLTQLMDIFTEDVETFVQSVAYSGSYILYREGDNLSEVRIYDPIKMYSQRLNVGAKTPVWLSNDSLGLFGSGDVETLYIPGFLD